MHEHQQEDISVSTLYVVPTPIGNLNDITKRALFILDNVNLIAAENIYHTNLLLQHYLIKTRLFSFHDHNEQRKTSILLNKLSDGYSIALVSNAGTPLINDPGYRLVHRCRELGIRIVPLPGPCAAITALSASGLPSNRFCYEGFLPVKRKARLDYLQAHKHEPRTLIFYESTHRLLETLKDISDTWGPQRYVVLARELTKIWETIYGAPVNELLLWLQADITRQKGEMSLIVEGYYKIKEAHTLLPKILRTFSILLTELPLKQAAALTGKIYEVKKKCFIAI